MDLHSPVGSHSSHRVLCSLPQMLVSAAASETPEARITFQNTAGERDRTQAILRSPLPGMGTKIGQLPAQPFADPTAGTVIGHMQCPSCQNCPWLKQQLYLSHGKPASHSTERNQGQPQHRQQSCSGNHGTQFSCTYMHGEESTISSCFRQLKLSFRSLCPPFHHSTSPWATLGLCHFFPHAMSPLGDSSCSTQWDTSQILVFHSRVQLPYTGGFPKWELHLPACM